MHQPLSCFFYPDFFYLSTPSLVFGYSPLVVKMASPFQTIMSSVQGGRRKAQEKGGKHFSPFEVLCLLFFLLLKFFVRLVGSQFPHQGLNLVTVVKAWNPNH